MSGNLIKLIAALAMLIDHIAWGFVPACSVPGSLMHLIGRITAPVMCFFIAEGYAHTRNVRRYALRLLAFAVISDLPFMAFEHSFSVHNVLFTLLLGLLSIWAWDKWIPIGRIFAVASLCWLSVCCHMDWSAIGILMCLVFWRFKDNFKAQCVYLAALALWACSRYGQWFQLGILLSLPLLYFYNGQRRVGKGFKWSFYLFYPAHLMVLGLLGA